MADVGFLRTGQKNECLGCEACVQICTHSALKMVEDHEGFRYPILNPEACINCGLCNRVCPEEESVKKNTGHQNAFGGYARNERVRCLSTSGGAFSCIVETWCKEDYVIFGAVTHGLDVFHTYVTDKRNIGDFRRSKYSQSRIGRSYQDARLFLREGKQVLFTGTPCQIAGLRKFLEVTRTEVSGLLTVEVVCEGVPSPLYVRKLDDYTNQRYKAPISSIDYRFKDGRYDYEGQDRHVSRKGRWDFQVMQIILGDGRVIKKDRWFNPFWSIWLNHLMTRPSCYSCPYTTRERVADITLGDLWGVHLYCPELYGENGGSSVIVANTSKGLEAMSDASEIMYGHELVIDDVIRYQGPMRKCIPMNPQRAEFMRDLEDPQISIQDINNKWSGKPTLRLLFSKYVWGNRQKVWLWNFKRKITGK